MDIELSKPQYEFVSCEHQFPAMVAGYGAGKTHAGIYRAIAKKLQYPNQNVGYYMPTYDLIKMTCFPRFTEIFAGLGMEFALNKSDFFIQVGEYGRIIFRSMDTPERIISYEVADSIVDELDTLKIDNARNVWNKIIARNRQRKPDGSKNTAGVVTTPEGFRFVYERWKKSPGKGYHIIQAPTSSNPHLPVGYIDSLKEVYPSNLLAAYLDGQFVNLTQGSVYPNFDRAQNASQENIKAGEPLYVGLDFNVQKMAAIVFVLRNGKPHAVAEHTDMLDTPATISLLKANYPKHRIMIFPDASGKSRKSNEASKSDIVLLNQAGFNVLVKPSNPAVKDRIMAVNKIIESRDMRVNVDNCPALVEGLEQQGYNKHGEPDKVSGFDHIIDAMGYFIWYRFPIAKRQMKSIEVLL